MLAEKHGDRLYLDEQTQETTFIIHIPLLQENTQEDDQVKLELLTSPVSDTDKELQTLEGKGSYSILLTKDNTELLSLTAEQLNKYYRILMARNGKETLVILKEANVDLVVSDIMIPEMDGYSLCESIKNNPQYCHIPVILFTAKTTTDDKIKGLQYGSDAYIEKPFSVQHLKTQIDNLLQNRQKLRKLSASSPLVTAETAEIMCTSRSNFYRCNPFTVCSPRPAGYSGQSVHRHFRRQWSGRSGANRQREKLLPSKSKAGIP